ncbi:substrate-binding domain-containing protein [Microbacterium sp. TNHR37B]|uniref:substrate-binding domain-containing protein n=1 Tax=Microbacterium sp. TNHR37B TaxID=1775956 RepID=UPI0007B1F3D1|nr:substrate-binding domain-containing protein [Microbacterium sp. TNHR37B]KZE91816.1 D-allose-binding periplasmic protein [Microbacterium sp. TNHR37B]
MITTTRMRTAGAAAATATILAVALAGCSSATEPTPSTSGAAEGGGKVAFVIKPLDNTYFGAMAEGAEAAAKEAGVELTVVAAENVTDDSGQASKLNALVTAGYDCYIVNPTSQTNLLTGLVPVSDAGTPIVNLDLPIDLDAAKDAGVKVTTYVGTNNETAGTAGGEAMLDLVDEGSQVALIGGLVADPGNIARLAGFEKAVAGKLEITQTVAADFDKAKAKSAAATILIANPDIKGFFTPSGDMAMGIQQAVEEAGLKGKVAVVGIDGTKDQLADIVAGGQPAAIEQFPYLMGVQSVQACVAAMGGKTIPETVETPVLIVNKDNAQAALDAFPAPPAGFEVPNPFE